MDAPAAKAYGLTLPDDPRVLTGRRLRQLRDGRFAASMIRTALRQIDPQDRVLELWSGMGLISALLTLRLGNRHIRTVEPAAPLCDYAQGLFQANGVETVDATHGLPGTRKGNSTFHLRGDLLASGTRDDQGDAHGGVVETTQVPVLNTGHLIRDFAPDVLIGDMSPAPAGLLNSADLSGLRLAVLTLPPQSAGPAVIADLFRALGDGGLTYSPKQSAGRVVTFRRDW